MQETPNSYFDVSAFVFKFYKYAAYLFPNRAYIEYATKDHIHCFIIPVYIKAIHKTFYEGAKRIFHIYFINVLFCTWVICCGTNGI